MGRADQRSCLGISPRRIHLLVLPGAAARWCLSVGSGFQLVKRHLCGDLRTRFRILRLGRPW